MREFDEVDRSVISVAEKLFFEQGIRKTEMKDIAVKCGIGRSTLYRRFESKDVIAFYIANDILALLSKDTAASLKNTEGMTAFEKFKKYAHAYAKTLITHSAEIRFLDEFDQIFTDEYPAEVGEVTFEKVHSGKVNPLCMLLEEGKKDGSMHFSESPVYMAWLFTNMIMGVGERVLPREQHYIDEQGYGKEFITSAVEIFINSVK